MMEQELTAQTLRTKHLIELALLESKRLGATAAEAVASVGVGLNVSVRMGELETLEHSKDENFAITVYVGQRKGTASMEGLNELAVQKMVAMACEMAAFTEPDPASGLPEKSDLATTWPELELYAPWSISVPEAMELARACESRGLSGAHISNSEGASVYSTENLRTYGTSLGFLETVYGSQHGLNCSLIAEKNGELQRDYGYTVARDPAMLDSLNVVADVAIAKATARLGAKRLPTQVAPVIFSNDIAPSLIKHFLSAIQGYQVYRKSSFLADACGEVIFPLGLDIYEDPFIPKALASCPYDAEGVQVSPGFLIKDGVLNSYLLDSYAARKLGLRTNGHAGGVHNIQVLSQSLSSFSDLLKAMGRGFLVTELMGQGVNLMTGTYSRGASGFWVENGQIQYPVHEVTIAGNLREMFQQIQGVANDGYRHHKINCGALLIERMQIAGE